MVSPRQIFQKNIIMRELKRTYDRNIIEVFFGESVNEHKHRVIILSKIHLLAKLTHDRKIK